MLVWSSPVDAPAAPYPLYDLQLVAPAQSGVLDHPQIVQEGLLL